MAYVDETGRTVPYCNLCKTCLFKRGSKKHSKTTKHKMS